MHYKIFLFFLFLNFNLQGMEQMLLIKKSAEVITMERSSNSSSNYEIHKTISSCVTGATLCGGTPFLALHNASLIAYLSTGAAGLLCCSLGSYLLFKKIKKLLPSLS